MKTFIKYPGGKANELGVINDNKPKTIQRYFEPFVGGGSVFFDLEVKDSYINDLSEDLISLYNYIKSQDPAFLDKLSSLNEEWKKLSKDNWETIDFTFISPDNKFADTFRCHKVNEERRRIKKTMQRASECPYIVDADQIALTSVKAAFYCTIRDVYNIERHSQTPNKMIRALAYYYIREFCYSSMFRFSTTGNFNVPYGGASYNHKDFDSKIALIQEYNLENTEIYNEDYLAFLNRFEFEETDFIFVDPPYDSEFSEYDGNSFDRNAQTHLAEALSKVSAKVMIIIKNTDFIYSLYKEKGFNIRSFDKKYSVNFQNRNQRDVKHLLITNY